MEVYLKKLPQISLMRMAELQNNICPYAIYKDALITFTEFSTTMRKKRMSKRLPRYFKKNDILVNAYQDKDLEELQDIFGVAGIIWEDEWERLGKKDTGSCCGGMGIQVWYAGPRKQSAQLRTVVSGPPTQSDICSEESVGPALKYLANNGIKDAEYYPGWMS